MKQGEQLMDVTKLRVQGSRVGTFVTMVLLALSTVVCAQSSNLASSLTQDEYLDGMNEGLDQVIKKCRDQPQHPVAFRANLIFAHEFAIKNMPLETLTKYVDTLKEAGVRGVDINMGLFPWLDGHQETIQKYDALIQHIRDSGIQLAINPQYSPIVHRFDNFADWQAAALKVYPEIARRYEPEVFIVVHEPTTMAARLGVQVSPSEWRRFAQRGAEVVKEVSPGTQVGAGVLPEERAYFDEFVSLKELDIISLDIYALRGLQAANKMIVVARERGKRVQIGETWRPPYYVPVAGQSETLDAISAKGIGQADFQALDAKWLEAMACYASAWDLEAVTPFWTQTFFKYTTNDGDALSAAYNKQVVEAINRGERTKTFEAFKEIIREATK